MGLRASRRCRSTACSSIPRASPASTATACCQFPGASRAAPTRPAPRRAERAPRRVAANLKPVLARLAAGETLTERRGRGRLRRHHVRRGHARADRRLADGACACAARRSTEITGAVRAMRARMTAIEAPAGAIDVCGTGGDGAGTLNISTAVTLRRRRLRRAGGQARQPRALVAHRRRRRAGGAGRQYRCAAGPAARRSCARPACGFLFAPRHHPPCATPPARAWSWARARSSTCWGRWPIRRGVKRQLTGVFAPAMDAADGGNAGAARHQARLDRARPGPGRTDRRRRRIRWLALQRRRDPRVHDRAGGRRADRARRSRRSAAATPAHNAAALLRAAARARAAPIATPCC